MTLSECNNVHAGSSACHMGPETSAVSPEEFLRADAIDSQLHPSDIELGNPRLIYAAPG